MQEICLESMESKERWKFTKRVIRIGMDASNDLSIPAQGGISGRHLMILLEDDGWWVEDLGTTTGTYVNGKRTVRAQLCKDDVLQIGTQGPRLIVRGIAPVLVAGGLKRGEGDSTRINIGEQEEPAGGVNSHNPTPCPSTLVSAEPVSATASQQREAAAAKTSAHFPNEHVRSGFQADQSGTNRDVIQANPATERMILRRLKVARNLVIVEFLMLLILAGLLMNQTRLIESNKEDLASMKRDAVERLLPRLDQRLKEFDTRLNSTQSMLEGVEGKMRESENRFLSRVNREMPKILDRYVEQKLREIKKAVEQK